MTRLLAGVFLGGLAVFILDLRREGGNLTENLVLLLLLGAFSAVAFVAGVLFVEQSRVSAQESSDRVSETLAELRTLVEEVRDGVQGHARDRLDEVAEGVSSIAEALAPRRSDRDDAEGEMAELAARDWLQEAAEKASENVRTSSDANDGPVYYFRASRGSSSDGDSILHLSFFGADGSFVLEALRRGLPDDTDRSQLGAMFVEARGRLGPEARFVSAARTSIGGFDFRA